MDETARGANLILVRLITDKAARIRYGANLRKEMMATIALGEEPQGYRPDWLRATVRGVFQYLAVQGALFNTLFPRDHISTDDFFDVLATATNKLKDVLR